MSRKPTGRPLTEMERAVMRIEMVEENVRELRGRQRELETSWGEFAPAVADHISTKVIIPAMVEGLMKAIRLPSTLEIRGVETPLSLGDMPEKLRRGKG
ncbi:MAG: hypothetical protein PHW65_04780 [Dehalococcoidales bacterium]|nr:hypothetical protein [Dehalococcoidales bacterium]